MTKFNAFGAIGFGSYKGLLLQVVGVERYEVVLMRLF